MHFPIYHEFQVTLESSSGEICAALRASLKVLFTNAGELSPAIAF